MDPEIDSYSGIFDNGHRRATGLGDFLAERGVTDLYVCGLATDYCVKYTALDAIALGLRVSIVPEACRAVDLAPGDGGRAIEEMRARGVEIAAAGPIASERAEKDE